MTRLSTAGLLLAANLLHAQTYLPRANFGAKLEPQGVIVHGAGQSQAANAAYWATMPIGRQPLAYMWYVDLSTLTANWADNLKATLLLYPGSFLIPQLGVNMSKGGGNGYEAQVAAGAYDTQIGYLVSGLRKLATPVYLRTGYEFNGASWNGYQPASYIQAYIRIANALRAATDIEVALVWDASIDGVTNYMDYYPGDSYVDWFGMNIFDGSSFSDPSLATFVVLARSHRRPILLAELTPRTVGAQDGATSWTTWFARLFNFLANNPEVKEFSYIDCDWSTTTLPTWGDSRLETDTATYVRNLYVAQLGNPVFLNGVSESAFRSLLAYNDTASPPAVADLTASTSANGAVTLTWTPVTDPSGIARYYLYRNGTVLDYTLASPYTDSGAGLGTTTYAIAAMDRAGNLSPLSATQTVNLNQVQRVMNGDFENGLTGWNFNSFDPGTAGTEVIDTANPIDGKASVKINVTKSSGTDWYLQLQQNLQVTQGLTYTVSFKARASASVSVPVVIQESGGANTVYFRNQFNATTTAAQFQYTFTASATQSAFLGFFVANIGTATLWLDDVSAVESLGAAKPPPSLLATGVSNGASFLPAIAPGGWVTIKGANLSPVASDTWDKTIVSGKLPTSLDGVSVSLGGQPAYIYYVSPGQINVLAPQIPAGQTTLSAATPAGATVPVTVNVASQAPAFFLWPGNQAVATRQDGSYAVKAGTFGGATTTAAAHPGDVIVLWGTGFGATTPAAAPGMVTPSDKLYNCDPVTATLGGAAVTVFGCALSPGWAGLYQVAIQVPPTLAAGDYALKVTIDNAVSPDGVILSIAQ